MDQCADPGSRELGFQSSSPTSPQIRRMSGYRAYLNSRRKSRASLNAVLGEELPRPPSGVQGLPDVLRPGPQRPESPDHDRPFSGSPRDKELSSRRLSHPPSLLPAAAPAYVIPKPPPPPSISFPSDTAYNPGTGMIDPIDSSMSQHGSLLRKLTSIRRPRAFGSNDRYTIIEEQEMDLKSCEDGVSVREVDEEASGSSPGYDISSFEGGPITLDTLAGLSYSGMKERDQALRDGPLAAKYQKLESEGVLTGGLGRGVILQEEMDEAVAPGLDLSTFEGASHRESIQSLANAATWKTSDPIFPPDPEEPNWKPHSMRWPYLSFLIFLALGFAGLQEFLYQKSKSLSERTPMDGLLKFKKPQDVSMLDWFAWQYLPTLVFVTYGVLWQTVDFEVKRLEPYYKLSRPNGALARSSLNMDYLTFETFLSPFKAIFFRQYAVVCSSVATILAGSVAPTLQSASLNLYPNQTDRDPDDYKYVQIQAVYSRLMTASMIVIAILGFALLFQLRRKSGLLSDPKGVAGIAAMANKSHILMDFNRLDTAKESAIHDRLKHRRYRLYKSSIWQGEFIKGSDVNQDNSLGKADNPHPHMLRLSGGIPYILYMVFFMAFIPVTMFTKANVVTTKLPWLMTALAVIIKLAWGSLECDVRMMEPFYVLSKRHAPAKTLTLDYTGTIPGYMPVLAAINGHFLLALVGVGSILTEVLTVCVSSFSVNGTEFLPAKYHEANHDERYNTAETFKSFWVSLALALGIVAFLAGVTAFVLARRRHPFLPRLPNTVASVLAYIHQSKMLYDFVDTERLTAGQMTRHLARKRKTYGLGWFRGRDGEEHCGIDEEPLLSNYRHGERFQDAVKPWVGNWDRW